MSDWTVDTLKEHIEREIKDLRTCMTTGFASSQLATEKALTSAQTAVDKAERLADVRAENQDRLAEATKAQQNEWRASLQDMTATYMSHAEYDAKHQVLEEKLASLSHRHDIDVANLRAEASEHRGRGMGANQAWVWVFLGVGAIVGLGGFLFGLIELLTK